MAWHGMCCNAQRQKLTVENIVQYEAGNAGPVQRLPSGTAVYD